MGDNGQSAPPDDVLAEVLSALLLASHVMVPDDLPRDVDAAVRRLGGRSATIYLADYQHRRLEPMTSAQSDAGLDINTTLAGRVFRTEQTLAAQADDGARLWLPLLDGTDRVGVLEVVVDADSPAIRAMLTPVTALVAELIIAKQHYGDRVAKTRRTEPMSLPAEMQWQLLPPLTLTTPDVAIAGALEPAYRVAGDAFDYALNGSIAHLGIIDAMGHGFEASVMAAVAVSAYRNSRREGRSLADTYDFMDTTISRQFGIDRFVTAQLVELDITAGAVTWLNAGHPAPLHVRRGKVIGTLSGEPSLPVGFGGGGPRLAVQHLEPGDDLLFFTDGVIEARSPTGDFFGDERLADLLIRAITAGFPPAETVRRLTHRILEHQQGQLQDDATLLLVRWSGPR